LYGMLNTANGFTRASKRYLPNSLLARCERLMRRQGLQRSPRPPNKSRTEPILTNIICLNSLLHSTGYCDCQKKVLLGASPSLLRPKNSRRHQRFKQGDSGGSNLNRLNGLIRAVIKPPNS